MLVFVCVCVFTLICLVTWLVLKRCLCVLWDLPVFVKSTKVRLTECNTTSQEIASDFLQSIVSLKGWKSLETAVKCSSCWPEPSTQTQPPILYLCMVHKAANYAWLWCEESNQSEGLWSITANLQIWLPVGHDELLSLYASVCHTHTLTHRHTHTRTHTHAIKYTEQKFYLKHIYCKNSMCVCMYVSFFS